MKEKLRIAWFSPLNIAEASCSVSAYFTDTILPYLSDNFEIELFHDSFQSYGNYQTFHFLKACNRHVEKPFDIFFYQLEDLPSSDFVRMHVGLKPGVVLFHDFMFSTHGPEPILNSPWKSTIEKFQNPAVPWPERGVKHQQSGPLAYREAGLAAVAVFSNVASHVDFKNNIDLGLSFEGEGIPSFYLQHPVAPVASLKLSTNGPKRIIYAGSPRIEHRTHKLLLALSQLDGYQLKWLLDREEKVQAEELLEEFGVQDVHFVLRRSPAKWFELVSKADIAVHTLFSVYGQPGPYLAASLMAGLPVIVTNFASTENLPEHLVFKIQPGETEATEIREVLRTLIASADFPQREEVREYAVEHFSRQMVAAELAQIFDRSCEHIKTIMKRWQELEGEAGKTLLREAPVYSVGENQDVLAAVSWDETLGPIFEELGWA